MIEAVDCVYGNAKMISVSSSLQGETIAIWEVCHLVYQHQCFFAQIESDCTVIALASLDKTPP